MQYRKKAIHDRILVAGMEEFSDKGFRNSSIASIAEKAQVPVGNMYRYFDGKNGLLDAIIKETYKAIPKLIDELAWLDVEKNLVENIEELMVHLSGMLISLFEQYGKEFVLLVDCCEGTRYEDFAEKLTEQVTHLVHVKFYGSDSLEIDRIMAKLASKAFIGSIFDTLRMNLPQEMLEETIKRLMKFYFYEIGVRK